MGNELYHYGVLGMKWGIRKDRRGSVGSSKKKTGEVEKYHEDYKRAHSKKRVSSMSDAELRSRLNRLQMEQQYRKLSSEKIGRGKSFMKKAVTAGATVASVTTTAITIYNNFDKIRKIVKK